MSWTVEVPAWVIGALGGATVLGAAATLLREAHRGHRRRRQHRRSSR